jgi:hypothetical protein
MRDGKTPEYMSSPNIISPSPICPADGPEPKVKHRLALIKNSTNAKSACL